MAHVRWKTNNNILLFYPFVQDANVDSFVPCFAFVLCIMTSAVLFYIDHKPPLFYHKSLLRAVWLHFFFSNHLSYMYMYPAGNYRGRCKGPHACTIFVSYLRPVLIIIHLSFLLLVTRKIASFTVKQSFSCLHACSMLTVVMSKDGWKMSLCTWKRV